MEFEVSTVQLKHLLKLMIYLRCISTSEPLEEQGYRDRKEVDLTRSPVTYT